MKTAEPLAGFRIAVTSERRAAELIEALQRRGAQVDHVPLLRLAPLDDEQQLLRQTRRLITVRPDIFVATTAYGMRRWFDVAEAAGLAEELSEALAACRIFARGSKALGALRALGFTEVATAVEGTSQELLRMLEPSLLAKVVAVQVHAEREHGLSGRLLGLGAQSVIEIEPYRWFPARADPAVHGLVKDICMGQYDAVTFTSAPGVHALMAAAAAQNMDSRLVEAFNDRVIAATVGPVTAQPLREARVLDPMVPERHRMGAMILKLATELSRNHSIQRRTAVGLCQLRGRQLMLDGVGCELSAPQAAMIRTLLEADGAVVTRDELAASMGANANRHAMDMVLSRTRKVLPNSALITTVIKRGYRIA